MMRKKLIMFLALFTFIPFVDAETIKTKNYSFLKQEGLKCNNLGFDVEFYDIDGNGKIHVVDENYKTYVWRTNSTCYEETIQGWLDTYNSKVVGESFVDEDDDGNMVYTVAKKLFDFEKGSLVLNEWAYDPDKEYWKIGDYGFEPDHDVNATNIYDKEVYVNKMFVHVSSTKYDSSKTYYKRDAEDDIYKKIDGSFTEKEALDIYIVEDDYEGKIFEEKSYTIPKSTIELLGQMHSDGEGGTTGKLSPTVINGAVVLEWVLKDGGLAGHYDKDGKEIYSDYKKYEMIQLTGNMIVLFNRNEKKIKVVDKDFNEIISFDNSYLASPNFGGDALVLDIDEEGVAKKYIFKQYSVLEGANQTVSSNSLSFRFSGDFDMFDKLLINGNEVDTANYSKSSGSTIIELNKKYVDGLNPGKYTITAVYKDGVEISTDFTKTAAVEQNPKTIDNILIYLLLGITGIGGMSLYKKRKINQL